MKKIAFILPYFGQFNNYFPLFMISVKNNPSIDWYIFTDSEQDYECLLSPFSNVKLIRESFENFCKRISGLFEFEIVLNNPYKLCDYRPAYGEALQSYINEYDFWGYCDCDLIFGDIRKFVTDEVLNKYNKIFTYGHMTLYRNTSEINSFYRRQTIVDIKTVFQSEQSRAFDESLGVSAIWKICGMPQFEEHCMDDIRVGFKGLKPTKTMKAMWRTYDKNEAVKYKTMRNVIYSYEGGRLFRIWRKNGDRNKIYREEIIYIHLQRRAMRVMLADLSGESFLIRDGEFIESEQVTRKNIKKICNEKGRVYNLLRNIYYVFEMSLLRRGLSIDKLTHFIGILHKKDSSKD